MNGDRDVSSTPESKLMANSLTPMMREKVGEEIALATRIVAVKAEVVRVKPKVEP